MVQVGAQRELSTVGGQVLGEAVGGAGGVGAHQDVPLAVGAARADLGGQWASASSNTAMWSAAVLEPALPARSSPTSASPVPDAPWSTLDSSG